MGFDAEGVKELVRAGISPIEHLEVTDLSDGCGDKFRIVCVSDEFQGKMPVERHRMIHEALGEAAMESIHALELKTWTVKQFEKKK